MLPLTVYSYDNDDTAPSKDQIAPQESLQDATHSNEIPGYGEEPDTGHDPASFDHDSAMPEQLGNEGMQDHNGDQQEYNDEPGIRMKEDG